MTTNYSETKAQEEAANRLVLTKNKIIEGLDKEIEKQKQIEMKLK